MKIIYNENQKVPIKMWLDDIEDNALDQALNLSKLPFVFKHVALMPDCHSGYGMPIGGVLATKDIIVPNAVGVDIGCGVLSCKTTLQEISIEQLKQIMSIIRKRIPLGFEHHKKDQDWYGFNLAPDISIIQKELQSSKKQLASLGGGNHFIEFQKGNDGYIYFMLHSGSRNFGLKIAKEYHNKAKKLCEKYYSNIPNNDLSFFPKDDILGFEYLEAMNYALFFAEENRKKMGNIIIDSIIQIIPNTDFNEFINVHHNYVEMENHFNKNVMVHRKGAIRVREDEIGLIPGSQGTKSYIVKGKGNPESFMSCSHGAGRKMGRKEAQKTLLLDDEISKLDKQGIIHSIRHVSDLDEASGAYKDIDIVMENQKDLVSIEVELTPLAVIKG